MARPTSTIRAGGSRSSDWLGLVDDVGTQIDETAAQVLQNFYRKRRSLVRRNGQAALGSASLSPDASLAGLVWTKLVDTEHLAGVTSTGSIVDFLAATVGATFSNGATRLSGADANGSWVEGKLFLGDGVDPNVRVGERSAGNAAAFTASTNDYLYKDTTSADIFTGQDLTVAVWVYATSLAGGASFDKAAMSMWDRTAMGGRDWFIGYDLGTSRFRFGVSDGLAVGTVDCSSVTPATGQWYLLVGRHNAATNVISIQVNGGTIHTGAWANGLSTAGPSFRVGGEYLAGTTIDEQWTGRVGPIGIWRSAEAGGGALSDGVMTTLYNGGVPLLYADLSAAQLTGLLRYYNLGEFSGTRDDATTVSATYDLLQRGTVSAGTGNNGGVDVAQAMVSQAPATFTAADAGAGSMGHGTFLYRVSFLNADGTYGEPSELVSVTTLFQPNTRDVFLNSLPVPAAGQDASGKVIWRLDPDAAFYYQVTTLASGTTSYNDTTASITGNLQLVLENTRFPPCRYFCVLGNRLVGAHCETSEGDVQTVFISNNEEPWYCPASPDLDDPNQGTRARLQGPAAGEITGICTHGGVVAVFTGSAGWLLIGDEPANFRLQQFCAHGCAAHRTIASVQSTLIWLGVDGVYLWDGAHVTRISDDVRGTIDDLTRAEMARAHAFVWENRWYLCWSGGCLYYDLTYHSWGELTNNLWRVATVTAFASEGRQRIYAGREGHSRVYQLETGSSDAIPAVGTAILARWTSRDWDMGLPGRDKRCHWIETKFKKSAGIATINLFRGTGECIQTVTHDLALSDINGATVSRKLESAVEEARDEFFRLDVQVSSTADTMELLACGLHYTLGS